MPEASNNHASTADAAPIADTVRWVERAVIGLNLCPFAKAVHVHGQIHYAVCREVNSAGVLKRLKDEILALQAIPSAERDTTLLIVPDALHDFLEYNDFLDECDALIESLDLAGVLQVASFHPAFQFAGTDVDDPGNCTNRSPYPSLHLLREDSIDRAVEAFPQASAIFERNVERLTEMGMAGWEALDVGARAASILVAGNAISNGDH